MNVPAERRVVYASFATAQPSGGVAVQAQHVTLLRAEGVDAYLWLPGEETLSWLDRPVPTVHGPHLDIGADDLLVLPEVPVTAGRDPAPGARKAIFNQDHFYTFAAEPLPSPDAPFPGWADEPALWTVSSESRDVLAALFPQTDVHLVRNFVDESIRPQPRDRVRIAWLPKKRPREATLLHRLLATDPRLAGVELCPLVDVSHSEIMATLAVTTVFIALSHSEGFGLPVAEALAAGCLVAGYDGGGGRELFDAPGAWAVPEQRPLLLRDQVVDLVARADDLASVAAQNRSWLLARYSSAQTRADLLAAVHSAWQRPGRASKAVHPEAWLSALGPNFTAYA